MSYIRVDDDGMAQYYIERGIKVSRGTLSPGEFPWGAGHWLAATNGVKRGEMLSLPVFLSLVFLSLYLMA